MKFVSFADMQEGTISQLHQELHDLQSHYEAQLVGKDQQLALKDLELQRHVKVTSESGGVVQQLDFAGGCGLGGATEGVERLKELAAQVEDLTFQLSTIQEELHAALERAEHFEVRISFHSS